jgi:lysophospholipase L1-like esterase
MPASASFAPRLEGAGRAPLVASIDGRGRGLVRFSAKLRAARDGQREYVRVLVFGDSHVQGGLYPDALRARLVDVLGDGGPGQVHAGSSEHPRRGVVQRARGFEARPRAPSSPIDDDRVVGIAGVDFEATREARVELEVRHDGPIDWELCARGRGAVELRDASGSRSMSLGATSPSRLGFTTSAPHAFELRVPTGTVLCGLEGIGEAPGVVIDALGVNGARLATVLARDEASFAEEIALAAPDLVVWALGTNETSDEPTKTPDYAAHLAELTARVHRAAPDAGCLVVGPTPRLDRDEASAAVDRALREASSEHGCAYFSWRDHFGDAERAKEAGALGPDGIHFTAKGYTAMGEALAAALLGDEPPR